MVSGALNRRDFLAAFGGTALANTAMPAWAAAAATTRKPNIVLIYADDLDCGTRTSTTGRQPRPAPPGR